MLFKENDKAIYLQIADAICDRILDGTFPPGERIPSVREYAAEVEVNANTVMRSYDCLASQGIIFNRRGIGFFIEENAADIVCRNRRKELLGDDLNTLFHRLNLLGITPQELQNLYSDFCKNLKTEQSK